MGGKLLTKRVYESEVKGTRGRGRPYTRCLDGALKGSLREVEAMALVLSASLPHHLPCVPGR